jgi:hypothetical protein
MAVRSAMTLSAVGRMIDTPMMNATIAASAPIASAMPNGEPMKAGSNPPDTRRSRSTPDRIVTSATTGSTVRCPRATS